MSMKSPHSTDFVVDLPRKREREESLVGIRGNRDLI
jgi:hypothetical protein